MAKTYVRDSHQNVIGWVEDFPGSQKLFNKSGRCVGVYDQQCNKTLNEHLTPIADGNILLTLL